MPTLFTRIVQGEIPCHKIAEDAEFLAFLDVRPVARGHALVIPKQETDYLFDLEDAKLGRLMVFVKMIAGILKQEIPCRKVGVMVAGLEVPHAHVHLIPIQKVTDLNFANAAPASAEDLAALSVRLQQRVKA